MKKRSNNKNKKSDNKKVVKKSDLILGFEKNAKYVRPKEKKK